MRNTRNSVGSVSGNGNFVVGGDSGGNVKAVRGNNNRVNGNDYPADSTVSVINGVTYVDGEPVD